ncbi:MAG: hypothetical protein LBK83_00690 [Treponema sp.]|jgi:hypothetical protein|nr:hypothetical protein [Treponema sp.]
MKIHAVTGLSLLCLLSLLLLSGCPDLMSTSWGDFAKRDPGKLIPAPDGNNVSDLVDAARGDKEFAKELLGKIKDEVNGKQGEEKAALQGAGISSAAAASGLDIELISNASKLISASSNPGEGSAETNAALNTMNDIYQDMKGTDLSSIANDLVVILDDEATFSADYHNSATGSKTTTDDITISIMVLFIAEAREGGYDNVNDYVDGFKTRKDVGESLSEKEQKAIFLAGLIGNQDGIGSLLDALGL